MSTYPISDEESIKIGNYFRYHAPLEEQQVKYEQIRRLAKELALSLLNLCPPSRERSIALTELETSVMWANASIARNEKPQENK